MNDVPCVLCTVANKVAFMEAGAVPAMMRLMDRGQDDPITAIALDAVTILRRITTRWTRLSRAPGCYPGWWR